jgi:hypothetical protein
MATIVKGVAGVAKNVAGQGLNSLENITGLDLDRDGHVGTPDEANNFDDEQTLSPGADAGAKQAAMNKALQQAAFGAVDDGADEAAAEKRFREEWGGILHPDTVIRGVYDMGQLAIMLYLAWLLPTRFAFSKGASGPLEVALDLIIDLSVWVDMVLQTRMYSYDAKTKKLFTNKAAIKRDYVRSWFFVDFFSVVPADQVLFLAGSIVLENTNSDSGIEWGYRLIEWSVTARLMRLLRLVRLAKIKQLLQVDKVVHNIYLALKTFKVTKLQVAFGFRVFFLVVIIFAAGHFLGCIWLMLGRGAVLNLQNPTGWMVSAYDQGTINKTKDFVSCISSDYDAEAWNAKHGSSCEANFKPGDVPCAPIPKEHPYDVDCSWIKDRKTTFGGTGYADGIGASESEQYLSAFYFSLVTVTTVGYGDILPETPTEKRFVVWAIMLGAFLYAYIVGDFSNLLKNLSLERDNFNAKMRSVNDLLSYLDASPMLRVKIQNFYGSWPLPKTSWILLVYGCFQIEIDRVAQILNLQASRDQQTSSMSYQLLYRSH